MVRVGYEGADIVEHGAEDLLKTFAAFFEVLGVGDVEDAIGLQDRQASDQPLLLENPRKAKKVGVPLALGSATPWGTVLWGKAFPASEIRPQ